MTREQMRAEKRHISSEISQHKHHLLDAVRKLESLSLHKDAERLAGILGRLEDFQVKRL